MATKEKAVVSADPDDLRRVEALVANGKYRTVSEFFREAVREKLERLDRTELAQQVSRYVQAGYAAEDEDLVDMQAFARGRSAPPGGRRRK